jgi:ankyrin repeat protein
MDVNSFHEQVKAGNLDGVRAALAEDPSLLDALNASGQSAFLLASYYRQPQIAKFLLGLNPKLDIFNACVAGLGDRVAVELDRDPSQLEALSTDGWMPLHLAVFFGHPELAASLLDRGAAVDSRSTNPMRNTPLHAAVAGGNATCVKVLLERGADANATQHGGWTGLHGAAQSGNTGIAELLVAAGARIDARADNGQSPLDMALANGKSAVVALLERLGATLKSQ